MTATAQLALGDDLDYEIVDGVKEVKKCGAKHGEICARVTAEIGIYLTQNRIGRIYNGNTTFQIGSNERLPDISFVSTTRVPAEGSLPVSGKSHLTWQSKSFCRTMFGKK